jgi:hypothetical protein
MIVHVSTRHSGVHTSKLAILTGEIPTRSLLDVPLLSMAAVVNMERSDIVLLAKISQRDESMTEFVGRLTD